MSRYEREMLTIVAGDTKAGTLIAKDKFGNKYYENLADELPCEHTGTLHQRQVLMRI